MRSGLSVRWELARDGAALPRGRNRGQGNPNGTALLGQLDWPLGVIATALGALPTGTVAVTVLVSVLTTDTLALPKFAT